LVAEVSRLQVNLSDPGWGQGRFLLLSSSRYTQRVYLVSVRYML
jgi:hypothetical protein